ncbi:MAG TPA: signal peptide peptidase SppA [Salinisphaeraceae bacterium]|nr:signal peptide peptidase SppA [Salinisphaeraceae bacterium]
MRARILTALLLCAALLSGCIVITPFSGGSDKLQEVVIQGKGSAKILWLPITGFISGTPQSRAFGLLHEPSTLERVNAALSRARQDPNLVAVILRIDSPGGTVAASDEIYAEINRFQKETEIPVLASLGTLATSGGYYVAVAADKIIAQPTTITGSIGVILVSFDASGLLHKLGIESETYISGPNKDLLSPLKHASPEERRIVQRILDDMYQRFVHVVRENRPSLNTNKLAEITDGRIFSAEQALALGLVDATGHVPDVIDAAQASAEVDQARIVRYYRGSRPPHNLYARAGGSDLAPRAAGNSSLLPGIGLDDLNGSHMLYLWPQGS